MYKVMTNSTESPYPNQMNRQTLTLEEAVAMVDSLATTAAKRYTYGQSFTERRGKATQRAMAIVSNVDLEDGEVTQQVIWIEKLN